MTGRSKAQLRCAADAFLVEHCEQRLWNQLRTPPPNVPMTGEVLARHAEGIAGDVLACVRELRRALEMFAESRAAIMSESAPPQPEPNA